MATRAGVGFSENPLSGDAGAEAARAALAQSGADACDLVLLYSTAKHDPIALRDGVRSVVGGRPRLFGGYGTGIITNDRLGYEGHQVGVAVVASDSMQIDMFIEQGLPDHEYDVGLALGRQVVGARYVGEPNMLLMYDIVKEMTAEGVSLNMATPLLAGMSEALGSWPRTAGAGMTGNLQFNPTFQWFDDRIEQQSALALVLSGSVRLDSIVMHGCRPSSRYYTITRAEGATVLELDGRRAVDVVGELLGSNSSTSWEGWPLFVTLGVNHGDKFGAFREDDYAVRLCTAVDGRRGGLVMFGDDLTTGTDVQLMRRSIDFSYVRQRAEELLQRIHGRKPFLALYVDCAGRQSQMCNTETEEAEEVQKTIGSDIPLLGFYSGCELAEVGGTMQAHNWTGVLNILSE